MHTFQHKQYNVTYWRTDCNKWFQYRIETFDGDKVVNDTVSLIAVNKTSELYIDSTALVEHMAAMFPRQGRKFKLTPMPPFSISSY